MKLTIGDWVCTFLLPWRSHSSNRHEEEKYNRPGGPLQQFRDFVYNNNRQVRKAKTRRNAEPSASKKMVYVEVNAEDSTTTFFVAEDRGDHLHRLSAKEIKTAKQVIEETFQPSHSIDGHAGTIVNSGGYRIDLQGYVNNCGTKWANVQL